MRILLTALAAVAFLASASAQSTTLVKTAPAAEKVSATADAPQPTKADAVKIEGTAPAKACCAGKKTADAACCAGKDGAKAHAGCEGKEGAKAHAGCEGHGHAHAATKTEAVGAGGVAPAETK